MNEIDYMAARLFTLELVELALKLAVIMMYAVAGVWVLGVIIMFWWAAIPIAAVVVLQAWRSTSEISATTSDVPSSEDAPRPHERQRPTPLPTPSAR